MQNNPNILRNGDLGDIDFRTRSIFVKPMGNFFGLDFTLPKTGAGMKVSKELKQIQNTVAAGIISSGRRINERVAVCVAQNQLANNCEQMMVCIADIFPLEE